MAPSPFNVYLRNFQAFLTKNCKNPDDKPNVLAKALKNITYAKKIISLIFLLIIQLKKISKKNKNTTHNTAHKPKNEYKKTDNPLKTMVTATKGTSTMSFQNV